MAAVGEHPYLAAQVRWLARIQAKERRQLVCQRRILPNIPAEVAGRGGSCSPAQGSNPLKHRDDKISFISELPLRVGTGNLRAAP